MYFSIKQLKKEEEQIFRTQIGFKDYNNKHDISVDLDHI